MGKDERNEGEKGEKIVLETVVVFQKLTKLAV